MKKVVIDCDVGVDDAMALILAFRSRVLEVKAITGVNGNVPLDRVFENIQKVLSLIRPASHPLIAKGADKPLKGKTLYAHSVHGEDGLGGAHIPIKKEDHFWQLSSLPAEVLLPTLARQEPEELTLIATGPLTNLALGIQRDVEGMKRFKEMVIMGGAVRASGNITPYAEFNLYSDPLAAQIVFESGIPITLVPLDVTHQVSLTPDFMEGKMKPLQNPFSNFIIQATGYDSFMRQFRNRERIFLHDPLAVGVAIDPTLVKTERLSLRVETEEGPYYGRIIEFPEGPKLDVCLNVEVERFLDLFLSSLRGMG
jgi:purine nucleosidase/pyrimidine-specific ribonucleoside hydrolase